MFPRMIIAPILAVSLAAVSAVSAAPQPSTADAVKAALEGAQAKPDDPKALATLLAVLPKVTVKEGGAQRTYFVFEGDQLMTPQFIQASLRAKSEDVEIAKTKGLELVVMRANGKDVYWPKGQRALTYAVDRASFRTQAEYDLAVASTAAAAKDWVDACAACGVSFEHRQSLDAGSNFSSVTFVVQFNPAATKYIARSFFPNDPAYHHQLELAPSYFATNLSVDRVGVVRHELGHVLGYRHEHIQNVAGCNLEGNDWRPITVYDPKSVMHYLCGGGGTTKLELTGFDRQGHRTVYQ